MTRLLFFLLGFGFSVIGFMFDIIYLNLIPIGYSYLEYFLFILKRPECVLGVIGFIILNISIFYKEKNYDIHI